MTMIPVYYMTIACQSSSDIDSECSNPSTYCRPPHLLNTTTPKRASASLGPALQMTGLKSVRITTETMFA